MGEDWSRPAPPSRQEQSRERASDDEWRDPWSIRVVDEERLHSWWTWHPYDPGLSSQQRLWREGGLVTIAEGEQTLVEGTATGAAVVREWSPVGVLVVQTAFYVLLWNLVGDDGLLHESVKGLLFAAPFIIGQVRMPTVRIDLVDSGGCPTTVHVQPQRRPFRWQGRRCRELAERLRADAVAAHPDAG